MYIYTLIYVCVCIYMVKGSESGAQLCELNPNSATY